MNDPYELTERNQQKPSGFDWFAKEVERIGRDSGLSLRLSWSPDVNRFYWGKWHKHYCARQYRKHVGWVKGKYEEIEGRNVFRAVSRHAWNAFPSLSPEGDHFLEDGHWLIADWLYWDVAWPRFVVEKLVDEESERPHHEANRYEYDVETNELVDALGEYPKEGKWKCIYIVAQHWIQCCKEANAEHRLCYGVGRPPVERDVEEVRKAIHEDLQFAKVGAVGSQSWQLAMMQELRDNKTERDKANLAMENTYGEIFKNEMMPTLRRILTPSVFHNKRNWLTVSKGDSDASGTDH